MIMLSERDWGQNRYLASDLRTTRLLLSVFGLDQREADRNDQEEGKEKIAEIHGCELPLFGGIVKEEREREQEGRPACNGVRRKLLHKVSNFCKWRSMIVAVWRGKLRE